MALARQRPQRQQRLLQRIRGMGIVDGDQGLSRHGQAIHPTGYRQQTAAGSNGSPTHSRHGRPKRR